MSVGEQGVDVFGLRERVVGEHRRANRAHLRRTRSRCQRSRGLGADPKAGPGRARQALAEIGEQRAISRPPAWSLDLALEDAQLVPEDQELQPKVGVGVTSIDQGLEDFLTPQASAEWNWRGRAR